MASTPARAKRGVERAAKKPKKDDSGVGRAIIGELPIFQQFVRIGGGLTPQGLSGFMRNADNGFPWQLIEVAKESRQKDGHLHGILQTRELAIQGLPWELYFPGQDPESTRGARQKKFVERALRDKPQFHKLIAHLSGGFYPGFSVAETIWGTQSGKELTGLVPTDFKPVDERRFGFAREDGRLIFRDVPTSADEIDLQTSFAPGKLVISQPRIVGDVPCREGLLRPLVWAALFRNWALADWLKLAEIAWKPHRVGKYKKAAFANKKDVDELVQLLRALTSSGVAAIPDTVELEVFWPQNGASSDSGHGTLFDVVGREMSKATLGQTETTESSDSSGYAQANVHDRIRGDVLCADAAHLSMVITRDLIAPMILMNFGDGAPIPYFRFIVDEGEDLVQFSKAMQQFVQAGLKIPSKWVRMRASIPTPEDGEEVIGEKPVDPNDPNADPNADPDAEGDEEKPKGKPKPKPKKAA